MRIAISGHRGLPVPVQALVGQAIRAALAGLNEVTGLSCLADGPDQIFARAVLDHGGPIEAGIPAALYPGGLPARAAPEDARPLARAGKGHRLPSAPSHSEADPAAREV